MKNLSLPDSNPTSVMCPSCRHTASPAGMEQLKASTSRALSERRAQPVQAGAVAGGGGAGTPSMLERYDNFDDIGHMAVLFLPLALVLLLMAVAAARVGLADLWAEGAIQAFLLLVVLPGAVWAVQSLARDWWAHRKHPAKAGPGPGVS